METTANRQITIRRKAETRAAKQALEAAGFRVGVHHGFGTASGWLKVTVHGPVLPVCDHASTPRCPDCAAWQPRRLSVIAIVQQATGRRGDYEGRIGYEDRSREPR